MRIAVLLVINCIYFAQKPSYLGALNRADDQDILEFVQMFKAPIKMPRRKELSQPTSVAQTDLLIANFPDFETTIYPPLGF
ncbi:hypothetical protein ACFLEY_12010 [Bradyrhizobium sp. YCK136]|uniref:hypothetical protein n=1 Tax=Bradyrhizobium TaxID=374 RepID=UPI001B8B0BD2|nr:hypothetical protein [Bradyrhizobium diazoefficiens]MBR0864965.1 hypothetical protein [Bradyrhizobium diazoefficiens]MBR0889497.1 hypothetical protein [Bradyrhizobium diazoefficiens]MBR0921205.1 hypothetical protein [Bradyrhizobium diazoefficiens]